MSQSTSIEWTDATWNPVRGCSRVSEGCRHCYAERVAARFSKPGQPYHGFAQRVAPRDDLDRVGGRRDGWTRKVALIPEKLDEPLRRRRWAEKFAAEHGRRPRVFVNSMSDLFHEALSNESIAAVFGVMAASPWIDFQVLTKRAERMRRWFEWAEKELRADPSMLLEDTTDALNLSVGELGKFYRRLCADVWPLPNVWLVVSVEDQPTADERIPHLLATPAAVRGVSYEPALGPVDFRAVPLHFGSSFWNPLAPPPPDAGGPWAKLGKIDWIIVGGESGPGARPFDVAWARSAVSQCREAGVPVFVKQLGARPWQAVPNHQFDPPGVDLACGCGGCDGMGSEPLFLRDRKGGDMSEWPEDLRVREFPK